MQDQFTPKNPFQNLTGKVFGPIAVQTFSHINWRYVRFWNCLCDCGSIRVLAEHVIKAVPGTCTVCRKQRTAAKREAERLERIANHIDTRSEYLCKQLDQIVLDRRKHWTAYQCIDWPYGASAPKGNMEQGYGVVTVNNRQERATKISFERFHRKLKKGESVLHHCDRPLCYHPGHLWAGSQRDNVLDAVAKKRHCRGETHGNHKLTDAQVFAVKRLLESGMGQTEVAKLFTVSNSLIWRIEHGFLRRDIT